MAANKQNWTDNTVKNLPGPLGRPYVDHHDDAIGGFALRVTDKGARIWRVSGSNKIDGTWQSYQRSLGKYPQVRLAEARAKALAIIAAAKAGETVRKSAQTDSEAVALARKRSEATRAAESTFGKVRVRFLEAKGAERREATMREYTRFLNTPELSGWTDRPLGEIDRREVFELVKRVEKARGHILANKLFVVLRAFFNWALSEMVIETAPTHGLKPPRGPQSRTRVLSDDELRIAYQSMDAAGVMAPLFRLLALTGQREGETAGLLWSEVLDLAGSAPLIALPGSRTKNKLPHNVPLSPLAAGILRSVPRTGSGFVFTFTGTTPVSGFSKAKLALDKAVEKRKEIEIRDARAAGDNAAADRLSLTFAKGWTLHDLRRTVVTGMSERKVLPHIVEAVVNHVSGAAKAGVAGIYNHAQYDEEKRVALDLWARHVQRLIDPQAAPRAVIAFTRAA